MSDAQAEDLAYELRLLHPRRGDLVVAYIDPCQLQSRASRPRCGSCARAACACSCCSRATSPASTGRLRRALTAAVMAHGLRVVDA